MIPTDILESCAEALTQVIKYRVAHRRALRRLADLARDRAAAEQKLQAALNTVAQYWGKPS